MYLALAQKLRAKLQELWNTGESCSRMGTRDDIQRGKIAWNKLGTDPKAVDTVGTGSA